MDASSIRTVGVVGAGTMGNGIAHVLARSGRRVILRDVDINYLERGIATICRNLERESQKGKLTEADAKAALARIETTTTLEKLADADFVIEAAPEIFELKADVFRTLDQVCPPGVVLASNTSSISITKLAAVTGRVERFIGMHFMNPVPVMQLVEVIRGIATSDETN